MGWPTKQRSRPARSFVNNEVGSHDVELARIVSLCVRASIWEKMSIFASTVSRMFSWIKSTSVQTSAKLLTGVMRRIMSAGLSCTKSAACMSFTSDSICPMHALSALASASKILTCKPARAKTMAHARPIKPAPTTPVFEECVKVVIARESPRYRLLKGFALKHLRLQENIQKQFVPQCLGRTPYDAKTHALTHVCA